MNKNQLDEMQTQRKNNIGNQSFLLLMYMLMIDAGLYGFGFRWIDYPANIMIMVTICAGIYLIRLINSNAYVGPSTQNQRTVLRIMLTVGMTVAIAAGIVVLLKHTSFTNTTQLNEMSAPIMFITGAIALIVALVTLVIRRSQ
ncbi:MAG: hypothetical protein H6Q64_2173 [Firmicutes bacterium]|nr:hypothetical protein [Bacillota bacterium]